MKAAPRVAALWVAVWLAIATAAVILFRIADATPRATPREDFDRSVRQLRSDALEAQRLARMIANGQLTTNFAMQQHRMLVDDVKDVRTALDKPAPREGSADAERARKAVEKLDELLKAVPVNLVDAAALDRIAADEAALARALGPDR